MQELPPTLQLLAAFPGLVVPSMCGFFCYYGNRQIIYLLHPERWCFAPHWWRSVAVFEARFCSATSWSCGCWSSVCVCTLTADDSCKLTCENGGKCIINEKGDPRCHCWPSYSGERCETNHCYNYCQNGGTCGASLLGKYFWTAPSCCYTCIKCLNLFLLMIFFSLYLLCLYLNNV